LPHGSYRLGKALLRLEQDSDGVTAVFTDGSSERGDLLVGADGIRSTVRNKVLPELRPSYAGYVAWRVMLGESDIPPAIHAEIFSSYTFCLPDGELLLGYPVPGSNNETHIGQRAYNIVWYRPADPVSALADLCTDANGRHYNEGIPPPLIRPEIETAIKAAACALVAPQIAEIIARSRPFFQPVYDLESPCIAFGRVALLGDAAFVARPHLGAGVTKAALDAASLADAIRAAGDDLDAAMALYQRQQGPFGSGMVALGRQEGAYLSAQLKPHELRTESERNRNFDSVIDSHVERRKRVRELVTERSLRAGR
jgi:2-polyprenyl-6-methoxyphenol hydroxylase-like FAD-dependent oxidoreductase